MGCPWGAAHTGNAPARNPKLINQTRLIRENTVVIAMVINHYGLYFLRASLEGKYSVINYKFNVNTSTGTAQN